MGLSPSPPSVLDLEVLVWPEIAVLWDGALDVLGLVGNARPEAVDERLSKDRDDVVVVEQRRLDVVEELRPLLDVGRLLVLHHRLLDLREADARERALAEGVLPYPGCGVARR